MRGMWLARTQAHPPHLSTGSIAAATERFPLNSLTPQVAPGTLPSPFVPFRHPPLFPLPHESAPPPLGGRSPVPFRPRHRFRLRRHLQRGPLPPPGPHRRRRMDRTPQPQRGQCRPLRLAHQRRHRLHPPHRHRHPRQGPPRHRPQPSHRRHPQRPRPMVRRALQSRRNPPAPRQ